MTDHITCTAFSCVFYLGKTVGGGLVWKVEYPQVWFLSLYAMVWMMEFTRSTISSASVCSRKKTEAVFQLGHVATSKCSGTACSGCSVGWYGSGIWSVPDCYTVILPDIVAGLAGSGCGLYLTTWLQSCLRRDVPSLLLVVMPASSREVKRRAVLPQSTSV